MSKVRVVQYVISPQVVVDDGEDLSPLPVQPITVPASQWQAFVDHGLSEALAALEQQVNQPAE